MPSAWTELAFDDDVHYERTFTPVGNARLKHKVARFRQMDLDDPHVQHDALEFPDGQLVKAGRLAAGQTATVLQLPFAAQRPEVAEAGHTARWSRVTLNRAFRPGKAAIPVPNQATVVLWQILRSTALRFSIRLLQSCRFSKAHKQLPAKINAKKIEASFKDEPIAVTVKKPAPEKKVAVKAA